jgi:hypothetical protein
MTHNDSVTTRPEPGNTNVTRIYLGCVFLGRVTGQLVFDATGRERVADDFCQFVLSAVTR